MPRSHLISANTQEPQQSRPEEKKQDKKTEDTKKTAPKPTAKADKPNPDIKTGNIEQGPCSNLQIGSSGTQTVNCGPVPPQFTLTTLKESVKVAENRYLTEFRLTIKTEQPIQFLFLKVEAPTITGRIDFWPEDFNGVWASQRRMSIGGPGYLSTNMTGVAAAAYLVQVFCTQPDKVTLTYDPTLHN